MEPGDGCRTVDGKDAVTEPTWTYLRRVLQPSPGCALPGFRADPGSGEPEALAQSLGVRLSNPLQNHAADTVTRTKGTQHPQVTAGEVPAMLVEGDHRARGTGVGVLVQNRGCFLGSGIPPENLA